MRLISECTGKKMCVGTTDGFIYKGKLVAYCEDTMNVGLESVQYTSNDGKTPWTPSEAIFIRGSNVRFLLLPKKAAKHELVKLFDKLKIGHDTSSKKPDTGREGGDRRSVVHGRDDRRDSRASPSSTTTDQRDSQLRNVFGVDRREDDRRGQVYVAGRGFGGGDRRGGAGGDRRSSYRNDDRQSSSGHDDRRSSYGHDDRRK